MENRRNLIVAVLLCIGILVVWDRFFLPKTQPAAPTPTSTAEHPAAPNANTPPKQPSGASGAVAEAPASRGPEERVTLTTAEAKFEFTTWDAGLRAAYLTEDQFLGRKGDKREPGAPLEILRGPGANATAFRISFQDADFQVPSDAAWTVSNRDASSVTFSTQTQGLTVTKRFVAAPSGYQVRLEVAVQNNSSGEKKHSLRLHIPGHQDESKKGGGIFSYAVASVEEMVCHVDGSLERNAVKDLAEEPRHYEGIVRWIAADERFFTLAAIPPRQPLQERRKCGQSGVGEDEGEVFVTLAPQRLAPGQQVTYPFALYTGPKYRKQLAQVQAPTMAGPGAATNAELTQADVELDASVNVTFAFISRPMMATLRAFYAFTGNWGLAIILLTILVKLITFYPAHKALLSGKRMARLAPKVAELKEKFGNDRERLGRETMALYKAQGVNVLGGCVPSLIQMPIWIALYSTLSYSVELYRANFVGYIHDLSAPDPYYLLPLVMGVTMFVQMRMTPAGTDPQQQKMMAVMMPIMFTGFQIFLPSGLALYVLTNYLLGIVHQVIINRLEKRHQVSPASKVAR